MEHNRVIYDRPYDSEIEYLESSGTQYIDTGIIPTSEYKYEVSVSKNADNTTEVVPLGSWNAWQNAMFGSDIKNSTVGIYLLWGSGSYQTNIITNDWITLYGERGLSKATLISTGEVLVSRNFAGNFTCNQSAYLFALNQNGSIKYKGSCKISRAKIWNGDTLVRDFIPVRIGQIGYMYDKVSGKLFANQGTRNFILGQDVANPVPNIRRVFRFANKRFVIPMPYESKVEYLKSNGNQYIDTAIYGSNNSKVEVDLQLLELGASKAIFGCYTSNNNGLYMYQAGGNSYGKWQFGFGWNANIGTTDTNRHLVVCENFDLTIDGSLIFSHMPRNFTTSYTMLLFNIHNNSGGIYSATGMRIFSCKLYNRGTLIRDFIPVRRGDIGYLYDKVSGKLFGNSGTGQFILGNDIND